VGGVEKTRVAVAMDNRDDRSVLEFWDNGWRHLWGSPSFTLEDHRG